MAKFGGTTFCITLQSKNKESESDSIPITENFDFAEALGCYIDILETVFNYLDCEDLRAAKLVKTSWKLVASKIIEKRIFMKYMIVNIPKIRHARNKESFFYSSINFGHSNFNTAIVLINTDMLALDSKFCLHNQANTNHGKVVLCAELLSQQLIPKDIKYCVLGCIGMASLPPKEINIKDDTSLFECCLLPSIPNVKISLFYWKPNVTNIQRFINSGDKLKCMLLFCEKKRNKITLLLDELSSIHALQNIALGGGKIDLSTLQLSKLKSKNQNDLCIAFTERKCEQSVFDSFSVVIEGDHLSLEAFEEQLVNFKEGIIIRSNSMAFRICCYAKRRKNHELRSFAKIFPNTPLMSMEADGEFGWDCYNTSGGSNELCEERSKKRKKSYPTVKHQWVTVIVFLTWGR